MRHATPTKHGWRHPEDVFYSLSIEEAGPLAFLYSSQPTTYSGRYSYLAWGSTHHLTTASWADVKRYIDSLAAECDIPQAFGYFSYEMRHELEELPFCPPSKIDLPFCQFFTPTNLLRFDHDQHEIEAWGTHAAHALETCRPKTDGYVPPTVDSLTAHTSRSTYLDQVDATREAIRNGNFYQANLTRKFFGTFQSAPDYAALFLTLQQKSPAPYAAYLRLNDTHILSSSPELFLSVDAAGLITTRPIKGTLARGLVSEQQQEQEQAQLLASLKDRAENLMIVDLMRNDLAHVAETGSVDASRLFDIDSFRTVHHLSSTITAQLAASYTYLDAIKAAFPPGSMTGAPKIAAMEWCAKHEAIARGVYSGALGWLGAKTTELSVVIRTLVLQENRFEFQVGGGIVSDSEPEKEWEETLTKARGIAQTLGISEESLAFL